MLTRTLIFTGLTGLVPAGTTVPANADTSLAELLPASTTVYVSLDVPAMLKGLEGTPLAEVWKETGLDETWGELNEGFIEGFAESLVEIDLEPTDFSWFLGGEMVFALGGIDVADRDDEGNVRFPTMTFLVDAGEKVEKLEAFMPKCIDLAREQGETPVVEEDFRGVTLYMLEKGLSDDAYEDVAEEVPMAMPEDVVLAQVGSTFMLTTSLDTAHEIVLASTGDESVAPLARDSDFELLRAKCGSPESMFFYVDTSKILDAVRSSVEEDEEAELFEDVLALLGAGDIRGFGGGFDIKRDGMSSDMYLLNPGPKRGLLWDVIGTKARVVPPAYLPGDVDHFSVIHVDFPSLWSNTKAFIEAMGESEEDFPPDPIGDAEAMLGVRFDDLFDSLDSEISYFSVPSAQDDLGQPGLGLSLAFNGLDFGIRLRDMEAIDLFRESLEAFVTEMDPAGWPFEEVEYLGRILHVLRADLLPPEVMSPTFSITDNLLLFSMQTETLQGIVRQLGSDTGGVSASKGYERVAGLYPAEAGYYSYTSGEFVKRYFGQIEMMFEMVQGFDPDVDEKMEKVAEVLPKLKQLVECFDAGLGYSTVSGDGVGLTNRWLFAKEVN